METINNMFDYRGACRFFTKCCIRCKKILIKEVIKVQANTLADPKQRFEIHSVRKGILVLYDFWA
jgi:hypothetical protein